MGIKIIKYLNEEADYKPSCDRCGYSITPVWILEKDNKEEWVCRNCLSKQEKVDIIASYSIDYANMRNLTEEESEACQRALDKMSKPTGVKLFD